MEKTTALILAGGVGRRMDSAIPKQFLSLGGTPIVSHSIKIFELSDKISDIVVVCHNDHIDRMESIFSEIQAKKIRCLIPGGETRQKSSFIGLKNCPPGTEYVLIHDSARPFISISMVDDLLSAARESGSAGPVIDNNDTVIETSEDFISKIPERDSLKRVQTPQAFRYDVIVHAHKMALKNGTTSASDDCGLVLNSGGKVRIVRGREENLKITSGLDMELAELIFMKERNLSPQG